MVKTQLINLEPLKETIKEKLLNIYDSTTYMNTDVVDVKVDIKEILNQYIEQQHIVQPKIYITSEAYVKMRKLVDATTTEIGWYGTVDKLPGINSYIITDIIVYPQIVSGATCEQDEDKMFDFEMSLTDEQVNHKRFHGHSHVNMSVGPSGVDEAFYQDILSQVTDYFIITITNKRNEYTVRFYDMENNIMYSDLPIQVITDKGDLVNDWYDEAQDKLTTKRTTVWKSSKITKEELDELEEQRSFDMYWDDWYEKSSWRTKKAGRPRKDVR